MSWESHIEDLIDECSNSELEWIKRLCNDRLRDNKKKNNSMTITLNIVREILKLHKRVVFIMDDSILCVITDQDLEYLEKLKDFEILDQISIMGLDENDKFYRINLANCLLNNKKLKPTMSNKHSEYIDYISIGLLTIYFSTDCEGDAISMVDEIYEMNYNLKEV